MVACTAPVFGPCFLAPDVPSGAYPETWHWNGCCRPNQTDLQRGANLELIHCSLDSNCHVCSVGGCVAKVVITFNHILTLWFLIFLSLIFWTHNAFSCCVAVASAFVVVCPTFLIVFWGGGGLAKHLACSLKFSCSQGQLLEVLCHVIFWFSVGEVDCGRSGKSMDNGPTQ
jgi:hypothetical protein